MDFNAEAQRIKLNLPSEVLGDYDTLNDRRSTMTRVRVNNTILKKVSDESTSQDVKRELGSMVGEQLCMEAFRYAVLRTKVTDGEDVSKLSKEELSKHLESFAAAVPETHFILVSAELAAHIHECELFVQSTTSSTNMMGLAEIGSMHGRNIIVDPYLPSSVTYVLKKGFFNFTVTTLPPDDELGQGFLVNVFHDPTGAYGISFQGTSIWDFGGGL